MDDEQAKASFFMVLGAFTVLAIIGLNYFFADVSIISNKDLSTLQDAKKFGVAYPESRYLKGYWFNESANFRIEKEKVNFIFNSEPLSKYCVVESIQANWVYYNCENPWGVQNEEA